ncbi:hypothetical protein COT75_03330 [Candidatus Beckwithbacteria bacterium CG10_big_fil_rev_8_21_14_0_10_34_10]|uniref:DUF5666 domain-containing protein n=1 Tax=Candidatus Beckwithbacteria bacterium CG10_big_fil_rev_8_21_14_0_10_34_10 TaxID=1974495 RepID=A0A2H0W8T2_9BACT|nr:MAG: hypothetical protein COT75_03330 [Candidatus Beckwithbacteria bacterium CG10_big_fil_rev_8_21_14_0_10_34_10]
MKKILRIILKIIIIISLLSTPVLAEEATPGAISDDEVKEKIKERLEEVSDKDLNEVKDEIEAEKKNQLFAWVGTVGETDGKTIKINTLGGIKETKANPEADIFELTPGKSKKEIDFKDIEVDQFIISMGIKETDNLILGKRIIVLDEAPVTEKREIIMGKVTEVDEETITLKKNGDREKIKISKNTKLKINGIKKPTAEDIQIDDFLNAVITLNKDGQIDEVKAVLVVPGESNPQAEVNEIKEPETEATPSVEKTED